MDNILAIIASPRKLGNCEIMVKEISRKIEKPHTLNLLRLSDFDIRPCRGCYACLFKTGCCVIKDDFNQLLKTIVEADALIVAAPAYFLGANASLKRFIDRGLAFYNHIEALWGKPSLGVGIAGIPGREGHTQLGLENFLRLILSAPKRCDIIYGALPGEIFLNDANKQVAQELANALYLPAQSPQNPCCPLCGGQTFRFYEKNHVRCMLCSNEGTLAMDGDTPRIDVALGAHPMFLTKTDVIEHKKWLIGMKSRFVENKQALKTISIDYLKDGNWLTPDQKDPS
jgi:multimeric flavodoxin WrbA